jgi:hypothetical protein
MKPIPLLSELYANIAADLVSKLGLTTEAQLKAVNAAFASVEAGQFKLVYLYLVDMQRNLSPFTMDPADQGGQLNRDGQLRLNRQPFPATDGYYTASVSGTAGSVIRAELTFKSNDDSESPGNLYIIDSEYILPGPTGVITLRSLDAGVDFILAIGDGLTPTEPVIGLNDTVLITAVTTAPTAAEDIELYRQKIIDSYRILPQGGARGDYRIWSGDAPGVQRVFVYVKNGDAGVMQIFVEAVPAVSTDGNGTPSSALIQLVDDVCTFDPDTTLPTDYRTRKPGTAILEINPITPIPVDIAITGLQTDTTAIRASISANLVAYLFGVRPFIAGVDLQTDKNDTLTAPKLQSVVSDTIGNANTFLAFVLSVNGVVVNTYQFGLGNIPYLRNLTYA